MFRLSSFWFVQGQFFICDHARARSTNSEAFLVCPVVVLSSHNLRATGKQGPDKELLWGVAYFIKYHTITRISLCVYIFGIFWITSWGPRHNRSKLMHCTVAEVSRSLMRTQELICCTLMVLWLLALPSPLASLLAFRSVWEEASLSSAKV